MSVSLDRSRAQARAAWLKDHSPNRKTGQCPLGCGRAIVNGGQPLLDHLSRCNGSRKTDRRRRT
jgi:hypothetical protein